jgi:hypothetical protein
MPISGISTNYSGRTVDVSILRTPNAQAIDPVTVTPAFGNPSQLCSGVQKLVQRYAIILLSNSGSQSGYPTFGTDFLKTLQQGLSPVDAIRARQIFSLADYNTVNVIKGYQITNPDIPADEQLSGTQLLDLTLYSGSISFSVQLTTLAGDIANFLLPLPI